jgi:outer membrane protein assembly factor BamB
MWRTILATTLLAVNACATVYRAGPASQDRVWRAYLGSDRRATATPESVAAEPQPLWRADVGRGVAGAPALTEDLVALSQVDRQVALLDRRTGEIIWRSRVSANLGSGPLVDYDRLYVATGTGDGQVIALSLDRGKSLWKTSLGDVAAPLTQHDTLLVAGTVAGWVTALSTATGERGWRVLLGGAVRAAPVIVASGVIVATARDSLFLLDRATGVIRARRGTQGTTLAAPAVADSLLLVGTTAGRLEACDTATLATRWSLDLGSGVVGSVAVQSDTAYALTGNGELWSVPLAAPARARHVALHVVARAGPTPVAGAVLVASVNGEVLMVDPGTGERRWSTRLPAPVVQPLIVDHGLLLAVSERGEVVAFR